MRPLDPPLSVDISYILHLHSCLPRVHEIDIPLVEHEAQQNCSTAMEEHVQFQANARSIIM